MSRLERIDYGTSYKYYPNPSLALGTSRYKQQPSGKQEFSLLNFNPHCGALGLQVEVCEAVAASYDLEDFIGVSINPYRCLQVLHVPTCYVKTVQQLLG